MSLFNPSVWLVLLGLLAGSFGVGYFKGGESERGKATAALLVASEKARQIEQNLRDDYGVLNDLKDQELRSVSAKLAAATSSLRSRPDRLPDSAQASCAGSDGRVLSRRDSEFLAGLAARADNLRAELYACQAREWEAYRALSEVTK